MRSVTVDFRERVFTLSPEPRPPSSHSWGFNLPWINLVSVRAGESISELIRSPSDNQSVAVWTTDLFMESCVQWRMSWLISCFSYRPSGGKNMFAADYKKTFERSSSFKIETLPLLPSRSLRVEAERLSSLRATVNSSCDKIFWIIFCLRNEFRVIGSSKENLSSGSGLIYAENLQRRESTFVNFHM